MASPRQLRKPPITEALVDLRATVELSESEFAAVAARFASEFPKRNERREYKAELQVREGKVVPPKVDDLFGGWMLSNSSETLRVQLSRTGFTFNNLRAYIGGDELISQALRIWREFADAARIESVSRVALRYINHLELPYKDGDDFDRFLAAPPVTPAGSPQGVSEFLSRVVCHDAERRATAIVTQHLKAGTAAPGMLLDVDVFSGDNRPAAENDLRQTLGVLRVIKNDTFFAYLTEEAVNLYV